jgi:hypothetical protein
MTLETEASSWPWQDVDVIFNATKSNLMLVEAKTHQLANDVVINYRTDKVDRILEVEMTAILSARVINNTVTTVPPTIQEPVTGREEIVDLGEPLAALNALPTDVARPDCDARSPVHVPS